MKRIVSLLPAATEWIYAFGAGEHLVGRSHACDYPPEVADVPAVTRSNIDTDTDSAEIDADVRRRLNEGLSLYEVDLERLEALDPDILVTQDQCNVCAVSPDALEEWLADEISEQVELLSIAPVTLKQVFDAALRIGRAIDRLEAAMHVIASGERRLQRIMNQLGIDRTGTLQGRSRPSVLCIEWMDPPMAAGHWTPDIVEKAGGRNVLGREGEPSHYISWDEAAAADPDVLALMPCGYELAETRANLQTCVDHPAWQTVRAVQEDRVFLIDGSAYFNRPGPRLYRSIELMAAVLHPDRMNDMRSSIEDWELQPYRSPASAPRS